MPSYVLLEKITVGSAGASSVTFSGIPQTGYTDLVIKTSLRSSRSGFDDYLSVVFNGDTGANYADRWVQGYNNIASSGVNAASGVSVQGGFVNGNGSTSSTFSSNELYIPNYTSSNYKTISVDAALENNSSSNYVLRLVANVWNSTAAITSITLTGISPFSQYSTFYLYGVAKLGTTPAIVPYATGGDTIMTDGTYWYHAFKASGTFTPQKALSCDYLVVAGGGGGGNAGGGAGGLRAITASSFASGTGYTVTIGAGGAGAVPGVSGSNSVFNSTTSTGGGGGGANGSSGSAGGSGGGAGVSGVTVGTKGTGTSGQGNDGGSGAIVAVGNLVGAGGGGAGAIGGNTSGTTCGAGGAGVNTYSSWLSPTGLGVSGYIAGGGGAAGNITTSAGGSGGGGTGDSTASGNGVANTGSGGGGGYNFYLGSGGSGLVIVRYAV